MADLTKKGLIGGMNNDLYPVSCGPSWHVNIQQRIADILWPLGSPIKLKIIASPMRPRIFLARETGNPNDHEAVTLSGKRRKHFRLPSAISSFLEPNPDGSTWYVHREAESGILIFLRGER